MSTKAYAATSATTPLAPFQFRGREMRDNDLLIEILYCGICHSDLHVVRNEWKNTLYPVVPGHEILGRVKEVGPGVNGFKAGDLVGVGCIIGSCQSCPSCHEGLEQYCEQGFTLVFNSKDHQTGEPNYGGFSESILVEDRYVVKVPEGFSEKELPAVAPILCAGITTYSPLKHWGAGPGKKVGVIGIGGLGHMAVKLAHAMGAHVTVFTTSAEKAKEAKRLGADEMVVSTDQHEMKAHASTLDFILNTVAAPHDLNNYLSLLKRDGTMCLVGLPSSPHTPPPEAANLIFGRKALAGSLIGGIAETQEVLDFCAKHHILADIELISIAQVNEAFERMLKGDIKYRFVIDMSSTLLRKSTFSG